MSQLNSLNPIGSGVSGGTGQYYAAPGASSNGVQYPLSHDTSHGVPSAYTDNGQSAYTDDHSQPDQFDRYLQNRDTDLSGGQYSSPEQVPSDEYADEDDDEYEEEEEQGTGMSMDDMQYDPHSRTFYHVPTDRLYVQDPSTQSFVELGPSQNTAQGYSNAYSDPYHRCYNSADTSSRPQSRFQARPPAAQSSTPGYNRPPSSFQSQPTMHDWKRGFAPLTPDRPANQSYPHHYPSYNTASNQTAPPSDETRYLPPPEVYRAPRKLIPGYNEDYEDDSDNYDPTIEGSVALCERFGIDPSSGWNVPFDIAKYNPANQPLTRHNDPTIEANLDEQGMTRAQRMFMYEFDKSNPELAAFLDRPPLSTGPGALFASDGGPARSATTDMTGSPSVIVNGGALTNRPESLSAYSAGLRYYGDEVEERNKKSRAVHAVGRGLRKITGLNALRKSDLRYKLFPGSE